MSSIVVAGDTSGSVTISAPAVAGTPTLTLPTTSGTIITTASSTGISGSAISSGTVAVAYGGTGTNSATAYAVQCGGTTSTGAHQSVASVGTAGQVLTSNGAGALPTFQTISSGGMTQLSSASMSGNSISISGLTLTGYKQLYLVLKGFNPGTSVAAIYVSDNNNNSSALKIPCANVATTNYHWSSVYIDLTTGGSPNEPITYYATSTTSPPTVGSTTTAGAGGWGVSGLSTASTTVYIRVAGASSFSAGTYYLYGVA